MPDEKDYQAIKAGVDGMLDDAPSPSDGEQLNSEPVNNENELPETDYTQTNYNNQSSENYYPQQEQYSSGSNQQINMDRIHEIIEAIISEKWEESMSGVGNLAVWKEKINHDIISIKQEVIRINERFEQLQNSIVGKVKDYDQGIKGIHTEMKALEKVFEKILEPLTTNIKDLNKVTQELKKIKR